MATDTEADGPAPADPPVRSSVGELPEPPVPSLPVRPPLQLDISPQLVSPLPHPCFRDPRLNLSLIRYTSHWPRFHHTVLPLLLYAPLALQAFLDANALYILAQLASDSSSRSWWIALAGYAFCSLLQYVGIELCYSGLFVYRRYWADARPDIASTYFGRRLYDLSCIRNYDYYCLLQRIRWSAWRDFRDERWHLAQPLAEECAWRMQTWPTVLTLIPRAGLCLAILLSYAFSAPDSGSLSAARDPALWQSDSHLSVYASSVLSATALLTGFQIFLLLLAAVTYFAISYTRGRNKVRIEYRRVYSQANTLPGSPSSSTTGDWRAAVHLRIEDALVLCASRHRPRRRRSTARKPHSLFLSPPPPDLTDDFAVVVDPPMRERPRASITYSSEAGHGLLDYAASFPLASSSHGHGTSSNDHCRLSTVSTTTTRPQLHLASEADEYALWSSLTTTDGLADHDSGASSSSSGDEEELGARRAPETALSAITELTEDARTMASSSRSHATRPSIEPGTESSAEEELELEGTPSETSVESDATSALRRRTSPTDTFGRRAPPSPEARGIE